MDASMEERLPAYARRGYAHPAPVHPSGKIEGSYDGYVIDIEYDEDAGVIRLTHVWSGPWDVLQILTPEQERNIQRQAEVYAWDE